MEDFFKIITDWLIPKRATYANPRNTYSGANGSIYPPGNSSKYPPVLYDYIWHKYVILISQNLIIDMSSNFCNFLS